MKSNDSDIVRNRTTQKVSGLEKTAGRRSGVKTKILLFFTSAAGKYLYSIIIISILSVILSYFNLHIGYQAISLVYLFVISLLPLLNFGPGPIFLSAVMSAFIWNFFFIPPYYTLRIAKVEDLLIFVMYFIFATVLGLLNARIRSQQIVINQREKRTSALYSLTRALSSAKSLDDVTENSIREIKATFDADAVFMYGELGNQLSRYPHPKSTYSLDAAELNIAEWVFINSEMAGRFTNSMPIASITFFPLALKEIKFGVVGIIFPEETTFSEEIESLLHAFIVQIVIAVERERLKEQAKLNLVIAESEKLYKTLFDSISHELKTPITTIVGSITSLGDKKIMKNEAALSALLKEANIAARRLSMLVENLLDMTRLESGNLRLKKEWGSIADLFNAIQERLTKESLAEHNVVFAAVPEPGLFQFDFILLEQALFNIIHNSIVYTPANSKIEVEARRRNKNIYITISDDGPGFPEETVNNLFKKFYRIPGTKAGGIGLGLSIAKGFVEAHGGTITARNRTSGGAQFTITLPITSESNEK